MNLKQLITGEIEAIKWFIINNEGNIKINVDF